MDCLFVDEETGESLSLPASNYEIRHRVVTVNNVETGEPESDVDSTTTNTRRIRFQIPKEVKETLSTKDGSSKCAKKLMQVEPVPVGKGFGQINPICLFLPAIIYFRWFVVLLVMFEVSLHIWAHHKNKALRNSSVYFRSPLHAISSEFCALCQSEACMNRVGKMQQIRMHKFLRQCNYMKRVVT